MLFVHIGRGKAASTSIQIFVARNRDAFKRAGLIYPSIGRSSDSQMHLAIALFADRQIKDLEVLKGILSDDSDGRYLVSSELLFNLHADGIKRLVDIALGHEIKVIAYIRDYATWIQSCYAQDTKKGRNTASFDDYFERKLTVASALPSLGRWAAALGWENIRVRSLDPAGLEGGSLATDLQHAILGRCLEEPLNYPGIRNAASPWQILELRRAMEQRRGRPRLSETEARAERRVMKVFMHCLKRSDDHLKATYLTAGQTERAAKLFDDDIAALNTQTLAHIPPHESTAIERPFLPSFDSVSSGLRKAFFRRLSVRLALARVFPIKEARNLADIRLVRDRLKGRTS